MKIDMHIHSSFSQDGTASPGELLKRCREIGLDGCSITDHNSMDGSLKASQLADEAGLVIVRGVEISTSDGHVLAYGISSLIPRGLSLKETVRRIHEQGGIAVAAHPTRFGSGMGTSNAANAGFDAVEVLNGGSSRRGNRIASRLARELQLPVTGGSDAHKIGEIGRAVTVVEGASSEGEVLKAITEGRSIVQGRSRSAVEGITYATEVAYEWVRRGFRRL